MGHVHERKPLHPLHTMHQLYSNKTPHNLERLLLPLPLEGERNSKEHFLFLDPQSGYSNTEHLRELVSGYYVQSFSLVPFGHQKKGNNRLGDDWFHAL